MMQWTRNSKGNMVPSVHDPKTGKKIGGGCPGMNPWHDGWKLHRLKGSVLAHFHLRVLSKALAAVRGAVEGAGSDKALGAALEALRAKVGPMASPLATAGLPKAGPDCKGVPHCGLIGKLGCQTAIQPSVVSPLAAVDDSGQAIALSLDNANGAKQHDEAMCRMGHIDHKYSALVAPKHGWASVALKGGLASGALMVCEPPTGWNRDPRIAELSNDKEVAWRLVGTKDGGATLALKNPEPIAITKACYEFRGVKDDAAKALGTEGVALQVRALSDKKAVRFDHVIWHTAR